MHIYQKHILDVLRTGKQLHYSELRPYGAESSYFKYHLDQLRRDKLVARVERGVYALTEKGQLTVDRLSVGRVKAMQTPKVITYTLLQRDGMYYLQRKNKEPFLGTCNMISGKVHLGERSQDAAVREVNEKTGLTAESLDHKLIAEVRIRTNDALISHFVAYVYTAKFIGDTSHLEKVAPNEISTLPDAAPDLVQLVDAITKKTTFIDLELSI